MGERKQYNGKEKPHYDKGKECPDWLEVTRAITLQKEKINKSKLERLMEKWKEKDTSYEQHGNENFFKCISFNYSLSLVEELGPELFFYTKQIVYHYNTEGSGLLCMHNTS